MHKNDVKADNIYANVEGTIGRITYGGRIFANYSRTNGFTGASLMNMLLTSPNLPVYDENGNFYHTGNNGRDGNDMACVIVQLAQWVVFLVRLKSLTG